MKRPEKGPPFWGLWIGAAATALVCLMWSVGALRAVTRYGWDLHFRHLGDIPADDSIVMIDINDHALEWVGAWPWPRRRHAELIDVLHELGARAIVMDIAFTEDRPPRTDRTDFDTYADEDPGRTVNVHASVTEEHAIDDDAELAAAIARAGNVYVAMLFQLAAPHADPERLLDRAMDLVSNDREIADAELSARFTPDERATAEPLFPLARVAALLRADFGLDVVEIADALGREIGTPESHDEVEALVVTAKRLVARREARRFLAESPDLDPLRPGLLWSRFFHRVMPDESAEGRIDHISPDRNELLKGLLHALALRASTRNAPPVADALSDLVRRGADASPPIQEIARAARGVGLVTYEREAVEGTVRKVPPVADIEGRIMGSLGFLAALELLEGDLSSMRRSERDLVVETSRGPRRVPLDGGGLTAINWHVPPRGDRPPAGGDWRSSFVHLPASRLMELADRREAIEKNRRRLGIELAELVQLSHEDTPAEYADYAALVRERNDLARARRLAETRDGLEGIEVRIAELNSTIDAYDREGLEWLAFQWNLRRDAAPDSDGEAARRDRVASLVEKWITRDFGGATARLNHDLARRRALRMESLRPRIAGRICFVGYTATAVADFVPAPVYSAMPGVMVHANIANMVLQNRFVRSAASWMNLLLIAASGLAMTVLTRMRGPAFGVASLCGINAVVVVAAGVAFREAGIQTDWLPACFCVCTSWAAVTAYRQFVEQRGRRRFRRALEQYTSPAVAAQIARTTQLQQGLDGALVPQPARVTCFFSDLQGFTSLSECLGAERTRDVLNRYLERMSAVLQAEGAIVNKFIGDGVFAFFNAPIWSCPNHAEAACASALAARRALAELNADSSKGDGAVSLAMRIGLATGEVFVGDYGSAAKLDYTCIGDTVNVGARLESVNKMFGSAILVDGATRTLAGDRFLLRPMGRLELSGIAAAVEVHELLSERSQSDAQTREMVRSFEEAIRSVEARRWDDATRHLQRCAEQAPDDRVVRWYLQAVERYRSTELPDDWHGAITIPDRYPPTF